ncbi:hypothetical protein MF406_11795 [Georgenia sp. TF02-10]|uniref:hypothetical protein n=1 Tax=Georgenia sp. TF02-10 TaxID=2917725 RepID=UPI001FA7A0A5|nr:hypothetical protein [Georgenia sp. TF02-10]UNX53669.1 hypothetical protein MF406_11795 [Georgenia sp. TF02-10]
MRTDEFDMLPMLSRGKHRNPRKGACFMELASFLAGERWSDRPRCTHPLLAHLARLVNDCSSDEARPRLAPLIPSVIGLTSDDPRWNHEIAYLAARRALPVVAEETQRALCVGLLSLDRMLARGDGRTEDQHRPETAAALAEVPLAAAWARDFIAHGIIGPARYHPGPVILDFAVPGIAAACVPDADDRLRDLLTTAIATCEQLRGRAERRDLRPEEWRSVVAPAVVG